MANKVKRLGKNLDIGMTAPGINLLVLERLPLKF
jgi:hypothetical protein